MFICLGGSEAPHMFSLTLVMAKRSYLLLGNGALLLYLRNSIAVRVLCAVILSAVAFMLMLCVCVTRPYRYYWLINLFADLI